MSPRHAPRSFSLTVQQPPPSLGRPLHPPHIHQCSGALSAMDAGPHRHQHRTISHRGLPFAPRLTPAPRNRSCVSGRSPVHVHNLATAHHHSTPPLARCLCHRPHHFINPTAFLVLLPLLRHHLYTHHMPGHFTTHLRNMPHRIRPSPPQVRSHIPSVRRHHHPQHSLQAGQAQLPLLLAPALPYPRAMDTISQQPVSTRFLDTFNASNRRPLAYTLFRRQPPHLALVPSRRGSHPHPPGHTSHQTPLVGQMALHAKCSTVHRAARPPQRHPHLHHHSIHPRME